MRAPEPALIRARAKAPLRDLQVLHLSNAGLECIANLEQCRHALRSLYAGENRLRDLDGLLVLRRLWRIDLSDNSLCSVNGKSPLHPLASLPALGFLCVERNQLCFEDLVCLRDMNIMEIRLQGNPTLHQDRSVLVEYHMKVAALLPNVWILDGHYISVREREHAIDEANEFVVYFLEKAKRSNDSVNAGKFGSTTDLWGGLSIASGGADEARIAVRNENVPRLVEHIHTQRTRNPDSEDRYRLQIIIALHNEESAVHNAHCKFAPSKFSRNARIMPRIPLRELFALPRRTRTEVATTLAAHLEYPMPKALLLEALTIQVLDYGELLTNAVEDLVSMPPYALSALLCLLRHHAMEEGETLQQELKLGISSCTPDSHSENTLWASMPPLLTTLLTYDKDTRHSAEKTCRSFANRCQFVVGLLSRAASFPDTGVDFQGSRTSKATSKSASELFSLVQIANMVSNDNISSATDPATDGTESLYIIGPGIDVSSCQLLQQDKMTRLPWKDKHLDRDYPRPWNTTNASALSPSISSPALRGVQELRQNSKRKPRAGEWLEIKPKQFLKIKHLSQDETQVFASSPIEASVSITIHVDRLSRVSSSLWRIADSDDTDELARFFEKVQRSSSSLTLGKLGKLHRDSKDFHRHGTARNQGFPNHFVTAGDLDGMKKATCDEGSYHEHLDHISQPVALFCSNDTIDANFVLAPPQLVSVQNYCAIKNFKELGESPTGLWSSINQASFVILADKASKAAPSSVRKTAKSDSSNSKLVTAQQEHNDHLHSLERESEWVDLRRQMESVLGIQPRQNQYLESTSLVLPAKQQDTLPSNEQGVSAEQEGSSPTIHSSRPSGLDTDDCALTRTSLQLPDPKRPVNLTDTDPTDSYAREITRSPQQSRTHSRSTAVSWLQVSMKPQLLVSSRSVPSLERVASGSLLPTATPISNSPAAKKLYAKQRNVTLPTLTSK